MKSAYGLGIGCWVFTRKSIEIWRFDSYVRWYSGKVFLLLNLGYTYRLISNGRAFSTCQKLNSVYLASFAVNEILPYHYHTVLTMKATTPWLDMVTIGRILDIYTSSFRYGIITPRYISILWMLFFFAYTLRKGSKCWFILHCRELCRWMAWKSEGWPCIKDIIHSRTAHRQGAISFLT